MLRALFLVLPRRGFIWAWPTGGFYLSRIYKYAFEPSKKWWLNQYPIMMGMTGEEVINCGHNAVANGIRELLTYLLWRLMSLVMFLFGMVTDFHSMGVCGAWPPDFHPWSFLQISVVGEPHRTQLIGGVKHAYYILLHLITSYYFLLLFDFPMDFHHFPMILQWFSNDFPMIPADPSWLSEFWQDDQPPPGAALGQVSGCRQPSRPPRRRRQRLRGHRVVHRGRHVAHGTSAADSFGTEGSKWVWGWSCALFISELHAHRLYIYIYIIYIYAYNLHHKVSLCTPCLRIRGLFPGLMDWSIHNCERWGSCYCSSGSITREIQVTLPTSAHLMQNSPKTKVCFSGSILLETFDIEVVSYDGNWYQLVKNADPMSFHGPYPAWRLGTIWHLGDASWTSDIKTRLLLRQGWHSEPQGLDWCSGWKLNGKTILRNYNYIHINKPTFLAGMVYTCLYCAILRPNGKVNWDGLLIFFCHILWLWTFNPSVDFRVLFNPNFCKSLGGFIQSGPMDLVPEERAHWYPTCWGSWSGGFEYLTKIYHLKVQ